MVTDRPPLNAALEAEYWKSDRIGNLEMPQDESLRVIAASIETALKSQQIAVVRRTCPEFLAAVAGFHHVRSPRVRVLAARPLRIRESGWASELFGDYDPRTMLIRVWMRTAIRKQVTSFGAFLSTLCHEYCHHLDYQQFGFRDSPHTRGFYERTAALYHHARGTPRKRLVWAPLPGGRWRINWPRTKADM
jgi:hypothetical protein